MDRPFTSQVVITDHQIDHKSACKALATPLGKVVVEMLPEAKKMGLIHLPDNVAGKFRPDVGIVISTAPDVYGIEVGEMVVVRPYDGTWIEGFEIPGYTAKGQVRVYGCYSEFQGETQQNNWNDSIPVKIEEGNMQAVGTKIIIKRRPLVTSEYGLDLPDSQKYRECIGTVVSIGSGARKVCGDGLSMLSTAHGDVQEGSTVHYNHRGVLDFEFQEDKDLAVIDAIDIEMLIQAA